MDLLQNGTKAEQNRKKGTTITVTSNGKDSEELSSELDNLINSKFGEDS